MYCTKCGTKLEDGAEVCPGCGQQLIPQTDKQIQTTNNKISVGFCILSVLFPLAGLIIFIAWMKDRPRQSKASGICALVAFVVELVAGMVLGVCLVLYAINHEIPPKDDTIDGPSIITPNNPQNPQQPQQPQRPSLPDYRPSVPVYENSADGVLTFTNFGKINNSCYDSLTDSVIVWNSRSVGVYGRTDGEEKYIFNYMLTISEVSAYNGKLCVGFGGIARQIVIIDLQTGESRTEYTEIYVERLAVTDGLAVFSDSDQWCTVMVLDLENYTQKMIFNSIYSPVFAINHKDKVMFVAETNLSSCDFFHIDLRTLTVTALSEFGEYSYFNSKMFFDGKYLHAFNNTYDGGTGQLIAYSEHAEDVSASGMYFTYTLCVNGNYSFISEYNNKTVVYDNQTKKIVYTLNFAADSIYPVGGDIYIATCGNSGYVGHIDLRTVSGSDSQSVKPGYNGTVEVNFRAQPVKHSGAPKPSSYTDSSDGVLTFKSYGNLKTTCYDNLTDSIIAWNSRTVSVYGRADGKLLYSFDYILNNVCTVSAYNGTLCVGFGEAVRQMAVIDLRTGSSKTVTTNVGVVKVAVTDGLAIYCNGDQWCDVVAYNLADGFHTPICSLYYPDLAINHKDKILYAVENNSSSCDIVYVNLRTLTFNDISQFSDYGGSSGGIYFDGKYVHTYGNTYDGITGYVVSDCEHAEAVNTSDMYLTRTLCVSGNYSFISEYDNRVVLYDNQSDEIVYTMNLAATEIYHLEGDIYIALCGNTGYVGVIDLSKI